MASSSKWKEINSYIQRVRDDCGRKSGVIDNNVSDAFADPESYEKILAAADQGIAGVNSAVRKYKNARDAFEKLFIERAKSYDDCKKKSKCNLGNSPKIIDFQSKLRLNSDLLRVISNIIGINKFATPKSWRFFYH